MKSSEIRRRFFDFFIKRGHEKVASSSLIPAQDPTLLFANAGMNQFKDVFLGAEKRSYTRAVSVQKCVRAGGKHNDLDNVGFTSRHLTFFEMMGNFSFGDYFKKEAIQFAWDFVTQELKLPVEKIHVTVFEKDDEAYDLWHTMIGVPTTRLHRLGAADNFWQMGDTGPCGPCTEIYIDQGPTIGCKKADCAPGCNCDRFLEIWNLVFMQYDRQPDGTDKPLKQTGVDTGSGLERVAAVMQGKTSVFEIDAFANIIKKTEELTGKQYKSDPQTTAAFNVLADHIRSSTFLIADNCAPSNEGRGYVLRKIIRRAALFAQKLTDKNIFPELSKVVVEDMGAEYPELKASATIVYKVLESEIEKFAANLVRGQGILEQYVAQHSESKMISGDQAFKLYDTYGFPIELIQIMADERGFKVDMDGFAHAMSKQKEQSGKKTADELTHIDFDGQVSSEFTGYNELETLSEVIALVADGKPVKSVKAGQECYVVAKKSPFFIVGGGQVPDQGWLTFGKTRVPLLEVRYIGTAIAPRITAPVDITVGNTVTSTVDPLWRTNAMKNHTATHMLQAALMEVLGKTIKQAGSLVHPDYLRFDFTYHDNLTPEQIKQVEDLVNKKIMEDIPLEIEYTSMKEATKKGALAFFGDKYNPEKVRIVDIPGFSAELCGGTHVPSTGVIGAFKITDVATPAAGQRRIFAVTGPKAVELFQDCFNTVKILSQEFKVKREEVLDTVQKQKDLVKELQSELKKVKKETIKARIPEWVSQIETIQSTPFLFVHLKDYSAEELRDIASMTQTQKPGLHFLISEIEGKTMFLATITPDLISAVNLKNFGQWLKDEHGLRGGSTPISIQGGGGKFDTNLKTQIIGWLKKQ